MHFSSIAEINETFFRSSNNISLCYSHGLNSKVKIKYTKHLGKNLIWTKFIVGLNFSSEKIFRRTKLFIIIFVTFKKFRHFYPTFFCPIRYIHTKDQIEKEFTPRM